MPGVGGVPSTRRSTDALPRGDSGEGLRNDAAAKPLMPGFIDAN